VKENFLKTKFEPTCVGSGVIRYAKDWLEKISKDDPEREDAGLKVLAWIGENLLSVKMVRK
jgi:hypothetical protein